MQHSVRALPKPKPTTRPPTASRVAYLVSEYPALSHTFITHEIAELEKRGYAIFPISIRRPINLDATTGVFKSESKRTFNLLESVPRMILQATVKQLFDSPTGLIRMLKRTFRLIRKNRCPIKSIAYLAEALVLIQEMKRRGIIHVHNHFGNAAANVSLIAAASGEIEYSLSIHGPDIFYNVDRDCLADKVEGAVFTRCISNYSKSQLCLITGHQHWGGLHIVRCGVDSNLFDPASKTNGSNSVPHLLCVGRLVAAKGQRILLQAAIALKNRGLDFQLTFVGTGPDEETLHRFASENELGKNVTFTGGLSPGKTLEHFKKADLFVLPSFAEGIPVVLMEAMSFEIPVISTPVAGIGELIESNKSGILVPPGCVNSLTDRIGDFLVTPDAWTELATAGRQRVLSEFQKNENGEKMGRLFDQYLTQIEGKNN